MYNKNIKDLKYKIHNLEKSNNFLISGFKRLIELKLVNVEKQANLNFYCLNFKNSQVFNYLEIVNSDFYKNDILVKITNEIKSTKPYRICEASYDNFELDLTTEKKKLKFSDLESIFKDLKLLFEKKDIS